MAKTEIKMHLPKIDDLFSTQKERDEDNLEKVIDISIDDIVDFPKHPFKVIDNDEMKQMVDSIKENGILVPALVRKKDNKYEMISGHRRKFASKEAGLETIPCIIRDLTDDEATIIMVDSNMQREKILPSEKAFAYKMKYDAIKHQGSRNDLTSGPMDQKLSATQIGQEHGESERTIRRYIRLTELIPQILQIVDSEKISLRPAVEISYLTKDEQKMLLDVMEQFVCTPSLEQAINIKNLSKEKKLFRTNLEEILEEEKPNQTPKLRVSMNRLKNVLPITLRNDREREEYVIKAVEFYDRYQKRKKEKEQER